jgi:mannosyltransferase OCH1-like enzyme
MNNVAESSIPSTLTTGGNRIIQGLWVGSELTILEQLSITSFLVHGHDYHLYTYNDVANVPSGAVIKDANEILPNSSIFQYKNRPSYAGFSNYFRYKLLWERGGWWADTDMICLRPFDFAEEYVFSSEILGSQEVITCCVIKARPGSAVMSYAWKVCQTKDPQRIVWGETGPQLTAQAVTKFSLNRHRKPYYVFCPIIDWHKLIEPYVAAIDGRAYAIHFWNEMWRLENCDKNAVYHPACIYEQLKATYLLYD